MKKPWGMRSRVSAAHTVAGTANAAGSVLTGAVNGKVLVLACLLDIDAFPWQADWYRSTIRAALGADNRDTVALQFMDNAHHENPLDALQRAHSVSFAGALQQGLRDLARWVEEGVSPAETAYRIKDAQVILPPDADERGGIQPVIELAVNGGERADVATGQEVAFTARITVPKDAGKLVSAQWDFEGAGDFPVEAQVEPGEVVTLTARWTYETAGQRFPALRVASQRDGDARTPYGRIENIALVRVVAR